MTSQFPSNHKPNLTLLPKYPLDQYSFPSIHMQSTLIELVAFVN